MDEKKKGNKIKTGLNITAKEFIIKKFHERFGKKYVWDKFKNKYDVCRRTYTKYKNKIQNRTGIGYDAIGRIDMSDDWWDERVKEWPDARNYKRKPVPNMDVYQEEFGAICVTGAEGWSAQQGETRLDCRVGAENDDEVDSFNTNMEAPPRLVTQHRAGSSGTRAGSSGSKRKRREVDMVSETCATRNAILTQKNELAQQMMERSESCSVVRVVNMLNELPGVRLWSPFHSAAVDHLLANEANRQGFIAFSSSENKIKYLEHRTKTYLDD